MSKSELLGAAAETDTALSFSTFLAQLSDGEFNTDLTDQMRDLVAALSDCFADNGGKPGGKIAITLSFKLDDGIVEVKPDLKVTKPKVAQRKSVFWATPGNNLTRRNPKQQELPLRDVSSKSDGTIRAV